MPRRRDDASDGWPLERYDSVASAGWTETHQRTKRSIPGITERMLIRHLQELVSDGIVKRDDKKTVPPCVYYSLSPYGMTLGPVVQMMCNWGRMHLKRVARTTRNTGME